MRKSKEFRENAETCITLSESATNSPAKKRFKRLAEGWESMAETQDWLDGQPSDAKSAECSGQKYVP